MTATSSKPALLPLLGIRVLELGSDVSLAFAGRLLADLGAEVLRPEPPGGDPLRAAAPMTEAGSALFIYLNHSKKLVPNLRPEVIAEADLLLWAPEAPGGAALGVLLPRREEKSRPPVVVFSAHGQSGPRAGMIGNAFTAQHAGGFAWHQASPVTDTDLQPPLGCPDHEAALLVGLIGANAAMVALTELRDDASPPWLDLSAEDVFAWNLVDALAEYHDGMLTPGRKRRPGKEITIAGGLVWLLPCADGTIVVSPREDHQWARWVELMGNPAWAQDQALCGTRAIRTARAAELGRLMREWSANVSARPIFEQAQAARVACFPVSTAHDLLSNRQLAARRFFRSFTVPGVAYLPMAGLPFTMRDSSAHTLPRATPISLQHDDGRGFISKDTFRPIFPGATRHAPLTGIRVVDFSWVVAGPMATKMLGALGAEIIKIESSQRAEFSFRDGWFAGINNNKRSCTIDITTREGQSLIRNLVTKSDVVVENFSSRVLRKNGLAYEDLQLLRPDLVYVSASGLGREGPERDLLAYGSLLQCYSGRVGLIGRANPQLEAMGVMPAWTDPVTSLWESFAILAALTHRAKTGHGAFIDLSMLEATVALLPDALLHAALGRAVPQDGGTMDICGVPSGLFRCAGEDEWIAISIRDASAWAGLCAALDRADWQMQHEFSTHAGRQKAGDMLHGAIAAWCRQRRSQDIQDLLQANEVPAARSRGIFDLVRDEHLKSRGVYRHLASGAWSIALPWMDADGWRGRLAPTPGLGADNDYVFGELLGLNGAQIEVLKQGGVIR